LTRHQLIDAEKRLVRRREYHFFEWDNPDDLIQADLTRFNGTTTYNGRRSFQKGMMGVTTER